MFYVRKRDRQNLEDTLKYLDKAREAITDLLSDDIDPYGKKVDTARNCARGAVGKMYQVRLSGCYAKEGDSVLLVE